IRPMHLAELGMVAWRFPADPALPWLAESVNLKQAAALIPKHHCNGEQLTEIDIINYRPEIRCTVRYGFRSANTLSQSSVYGKNYADHHGRMIYNNLLAVSALSQHDEAFVIPTALGYDADRHILWLEGLDAVSLKAVLFGANPQPFISRLCRALSAFQQISLPQLTLISAAQNLRDWQKKARKLAHSYVELGDALQSLLRNLENNYAESAAQGLIHGDFHIEQLALLASGRIALFDFDELALGDPLQDLANFAADLYKHQLPTEHIDRLIDKLFNAYRLASIAKVTPDRFYWQLRGQLLTRAYRAHIQQCPDTSRQVARFIALANRPSPQHSELSLWNTAHEPV
ncbi:MAG: aminoglycoside phosphotransferase family protein, partial [Methylococcales bacterium]